MRRRDLFKYFSGAVLLSGPSRVFSSEDTVKFTRAEVTRFSRIENPYGAPAVKYEASDVHIYQTQLDATESLRMKITSSQQLGSGCKVGLCPGSSFFLEKILMISKEKIQTAVVCEVDYYKLLFLFDYYKFSKKLVGYKKNLKVSDYDKKILNKEVLVYLSNPNQPAGHLFKRNDMEWLIKKNPNATFVVDEAYIEFIENSQEHSLINLCSKYRNLVVTRTFSKIYGLAAKRVGYFVCHTDLYRKIGWGHLEEFTIGVDALSSAVAMLGDKKYKENSMKTAEELRSEFREKCEKKLIEYVGGHANYSLIKANPQVISNLKKFKIPYNEYFYKNFGLIRVTHWRGAVYDQLIIS